jgi:hypothetical protein
MLHARPAPSLGTSRGRAPDTTAFVLVPNGHDQAGQYQLMRRPFEWVGIVAD